MPLKIKAKDDFIADVTPDILVWARVNEGMITNEASKRLGISKKYLIELEHCNTKVKQIRWSLIKKMAKLYRRPSAAFLLSKPPKQDRKVIKRLIVDYNDGTQIPFEPVEE